MIFFLSSGSNGLQLTFHYFSFPAPPLCWWQVHNNFAPAEQLSWQQFKKLGQDKRTNSFPNETPSQHYCRLFIRKCKALVFIILWSIGVMAPKRSLSGPSLLINVLCKCSFFLPKSASKRFKLKLKHFSTIISSWRWIAYTCAHTHMPPYRRWPGSTVRVIVCTLAPLQGPLPCFSALNFAMISGRLKPICFCHCSRPILLLLAALIKTKAFCLVAVRPVPAQARWCVEQHWPDV